MFRMTPSERSLMQKLLYVVAGVAAAAVVSRVGSAQSVDATIDHAAAAWAKVKTARGSFEQTVSNAITGGSATARGEFAQERPNRLAIRFMEPAGDAIV